jgi:hypothetical protein
MWEDYHRNPERVNGEEQLARESIWTPYRTEKSYSVKPATRDGKVGNVILGGVV